VDFNVTDQLLIKYSTFVRYWRKTGNGNIMHNTSVIDFEKAYDF